MTTAQKYKRQLCLLKAKWLSAACGISGEEGGSSERSAPWASSWGKLVEVEREQVERTQDPLTRDDPQLLSPLSNHSRNPTAPPKWPRSNLGAGGRGAPTLTFLLCDGAELGVAGLGNSGLLQHGAAHGRPAPCQALHGPRLHATPAAGCALRETRATVRLGHPAVPPPLPVGRPLLPGSSRRSLSLSLDGVGG